MGDLSRKLEEKRTQLERLARRWAFESYLRYGRVPPEAKALNKGDRHLRTTVAYRVVQALQIQQTAGAGRSREMANR